MMFLFFALSAFASQDTYLVLPERYAHGHYRLAGGQQNEYCFEGQIQVKQGGSLLVFNARELLGLKPEEYSQDDRCTEHTVTSLREENDGVVIIDSLTRFEACADKSEHTDGPDRWVFNGRELTIAHMGTGVNIVCRFVRR